MTKAKSDALSTSKGGKPKRPSTMVSMTRFLDNFRRLGVVGPAARLANLHRTTIHAWRARYPWFEREFTDAGEDAMDTAESEVVRRGVVGWNTPVFYRGQEVGQIRNYDSTLLLALLRARRSGAWGQPQKVELAGTLAVSMDMVDARLREMPAGDRSRLRELLVLEGRTPAQSKELRDLMALVGLEPERRKS